MDSGHRTRELKLKKGSTFLRKWETRGELASGEGRPPRWPAAALMPQLVCVLLLLADRVLPKPCSRTQLQSPSVRSYVSSHPPTLGSSVPFEEVS